MEIQIIDDATVILAILILSSYLIKIKNYNLLT